MMEQYSKAGKSKVELDYELRLTKKILQLILERNKDIKMPEPKEVDQIEEELRKELEDEYPQFKIRTKK